MTWVNFQTVRENLDVHDVLEHFGFTIESGNTKQLKIHCPFHDDSKPSCGFDIEKKVFNCFSCHAKGNVLDFFARMEGFDPSKPRELRKAAVAAVETFGIDGGTREENSGDQPKAKKRPGKGEKCGAAASKEERSSPPTSEQNDPAQGQYEAEDVANPANPPLTFELKLDPDHAFIRRRQIDRKLVEEFGIGFAKRGSMKGRVCFPVHNETGDLIAYAGRWAGEQVPDDTPRYLLPKGFEKSLVLYNLNRVIDRRARLADEERRLGKVVVIVEGYWSVLRLHAHGIPVVASFGDSLSAQQVALLVDAGFSGAVLVFDGDEGGRSGTEQALPLLAPYLYTKTIMLGDGEKPDTMGEELVQELPRYTL